MSGTSDAEKVLLRKDAANAKLAKKLAKNRREAKQKAQKTRADTEKLQRYIPPSPGWNNYNAFMSIIPTIYEGSSFKRKDLTDMYARFSGEWRQGVNEAQAKIYKMMTNPVKGAEPLVFNSRAAYLNELRNGLVNNNNSFYKHLKSGTSPDPDNPQQTITDWWETAGQAQRESRQDFSETHIKSNLKSDYADAGKTPFAAPTDEPKTKYTPGSYVEGLGVVGAGGKLSKGFTTNVGGGEIDTEVEKTTKGDEVTKGPQSVGVATKNLRPSFVIAGGEDVKPDEEANLQSDALFEAFSWVPDGYGLGPANNLHLMNKQNDALRFGMDPLSLPRQLVDTNMPHSFPVQWNESMPDAMIEQFLDEQEGLEMLIEQGFLAQESNPVKVLDHDYNNFPSYKDLPRQLGGPSPFEPVVDNTEQYWPSSDPSGYLMDSLGFQDSLAGTQGHKRLSTFGRL